MQQDDLFAKWKNCRFLYIFSFSVILCNIRAFRGFSKAALKNLLSMTSYNSVSLSVCVVVEPGWGGGGDRVEDDNACGITKRLGIVEGCCLEDEKYFFNSFAFQGMHVKHNNLVLQIIKEKTLAYKIQILY